MTTKVLRTAIIDRDGNVEVVYDREVAGSQKPKTARGRWNAAVIAGRELIRQADLVSEDDLRVVKVQVYGEISGGESDFCAAGERVDLTFSDNTSELIGDTEVVPAALASARDAFKTAALAAIESVTGR